MTPGHLIDLAQSFDAKAARHTDPAAPPRPPAAGVADIDDAGTTNPHHHGDPR